MPIVKLSKLLKTVLLFDAATCFLMGLLLILLAGQLKELLEVPAALLSGAAMILLPFAAFVLFTGTRQQISSAFVWAIILLNAGWTLASFFLLIAGSITPNQTGIAFISAQALAVAGLAALELTGLKQSAAR